MASTLIGRLLYDLPDGRPVCRWSNVRDRGHDYTDLALVTDGLRAEREQGITIDAAYRYFATLSEIHHTHPGTHPDRNGDRCVHRPTGDRTADARTACWSNPAGIAFLASLLHPPPGARGQQDGLAWLGPREIRRDSRRIPRLRGPPRRRTSPPSQSPRCIGDNVVTNHRRPVQGPSLLSHLEDVYIAG